MSRPAPEFRDYALLMLLGAIWGASFMVIKVGVETLPPATLTLGRVGFAALLVWGLARIAGESMAWGPGIWGWIAVTALFGNTVPFVLIGWGEQRIDSGLAAILVAIMPLTTVLIAHLTTRDEKLERGKGIGVVLGLAGIVLLIGPRQLASLGDDTLRQLAVAGAAVCYAINAVLMKRLVHLPARALSAALLGSGALMLVPASLLLDRPWELVPSGRSLLALSVLAILQTGIATLMMVRLVRRRGASFFALINYLVPLFGVLWGALFLAERPDPGALLALGVILFGIGIARGGGGGEARQPPPAEARRRGH